MFHHRRNRWLALVLSLSVLICAAEGEPIPGIKDRDDRVMVESTAYPWRAIGRVNGTLGGFCTGVLVGPRRVLTAAHCLWNPRTGNWLPACALHFLAGYQRGHYLAHSLVVSYRLVDEEDLRKNPRPPRPDRDWAVLNLAEDLSEVAAVLTTAPLDRESLADYRRQGGTFLQAGYSRDRPHVLTTHKGCAFEGFSRDNQLLLHDCDATFGDSGSPILLRRNGAYLVVALHVAMENKSGRGVAVTGSAFHDWLRGLEPPGPVDRKLKAC